jgi:hypothetical protein
VSPDDAAAQGDNMPLALLGWFAGCTVIWSGLFAVGNYLYGRMNYALMLAVVFVISGSVLIALIRKLWAGDDNQPSITPGPAPVPAPQR